MSLNITRIEWDDVKIRANLRSSSERALREAGEFLLETSNRTIPIDEGTLMRSGMVTADNKDAYVSYSTPYAVRLHENPQYNFRRGRRGKWLELTLREQQKGIAERLAKALSEGLK